MAAYIDIDDLRGAIQAHLKLDDAAEVPDSFEVYGERSLQYAYDDILSRLTARGYTIAQIDAWDRREEYNRDIAIWFALRDMGETEDSDLWPEKFDRRDELDSVFILSGQAPIDPGDSGSGPASSGRINTSNGRYNRYTGW